MALTAITLLISACGGDSASDPTPGVNGDDNPPVSDCGTRCPTNETVTLNWTANADVEALSGYRIYAVDASNNETLLSDIGINDTGFSKALPSVSYQIQGDLQLLAGDQACFKVEAYNVIGDSPRSDEICSTIN